jgi:uncharacterized membrane protein YccC
LTKRIFLWPGHHQWFSIPLATAIGLIWVLGVHLAHPYRITLGIGFVIGISWVAAATRIVDPQQPIWGTMVKDLTGIVIFLGQRPALVFAGIWICLGLILAAPMYIGPWTKNPANILPLISWCVVTLFFLDLDEYGPGD